MAVLIALARRPAGRATLDELSEDVTRLIAECDEKIGNPEQLSGLDHIDVFQSGLVASDGDSLWITEYGRSLLRALGISAQELADPDLASTLLLNSIDELIDTEALLKGSNSEPRSVDQNADFVAPHDETGGLEALSRTSRPAGPSLPTGGNDGGMADAPAFMIRKFGSALRGAPPSSNLLGKLTQRVREAIGIWRRDLQQDRLPRETRAGANIERGLLALLSLLVIVSCAGAVTALMQVKSLKSELTALQRELLPLRERVARLDQIEKSREASDKASDQKSQPSRESRAEEAPLLLSREEIQLVRDFIKPAPVVGSSTAPINVGDPVTGPTIPFPSPLAEKISKLIGARFAIRNGAIIILKKDSRRADAVLGPN